MKITVIGAGNVGGLTAMRLAQDGLGDVCLIDVVKGLGAGKAFDMEDARQILKYNYRIKGSDDLKDTEDSDVIVITAGLPRKPGMTREELLNKNASILKDICLHIKTGAPQAIIVTVTNPLDLMTTFVLKATGFKPSRVFGMGITLDAARFANLIAQELGLSPADIEPCVIGTHGEGMLPLPRLTTVKGVKLEEFLDEKKVRSLVEGTVARGLQIVTLLGSGSAYFAPSAAVSQIVRAVAKDEKRVLGVSAYLSGEYGIKDICLGLPCRLGRQGIEEVIRLDLNAQEKDALANSAQKLKEQYSKITA
ncbi:MAG TPA: malate dehydrogenase [Patescibacteria group bacterium]|nr:malate dehydrogenase [Patescibacteria group bacterium]